MPRLKANPFNKVENKINHAGKALVGKIKERSFLQNIKYDGIAITMRTSQKTYYQRLKHPEKFTLEEIIRLGAKFNFTAEDYLNILGKEIKK